MRSRENFWNFIMRSELISINYYQLLGINRNATRDEITRAYRKAIFKNHPDRNPGKEAEKLQISILLNDAYEVLTNNETKTEYDRTISNIDLKRDLQKKKEKNLEFLRKRIKEHILKFDNYYSDLQLKDQYEVVLSHREIKKIIEKQVKIDLNSRFIDLDFVTANDDYNWYFFSPANIYKRKYCVVLNSFENKLFYVLLIEKADYDALFKKRKTYNAGLYFSGKSIKYLDKSLDKYIRCIIHYNKKEGT
jgi:curved DNA-binding protein CbpA